jgi:2-polyprenyl-3-methyl-5-hydroxy-6-metoxy-1,4-benzoquinol methylase
MKEENYITENRELWNARVPVHVDSEFYGMKEFLDGKNSLKEIELELLGDVKGKSILHLQCHFGQDSLSLARMEATVTGVDLSDAAIQKAIEINAQIGTNAEFICCDVYSLKDHLDKKFDIVFTSYGTIGWLPDLDKWANIVSHSLKPGGEFVFAEFHPVVWMFDDHFKEVAYSYFNVETIITESQGTYTDRNAEIKHKEYGWNHPLEEVLTSLLQSGLTITAFKEFDYSPYNCFKNMIKGENERYYIEHLGKKMPMVYSIKAKK